MPGRQRSLRSGWRPDVEFKPAPDAPAKPTQIESASTSYLCTPPDHDTSELLRGAPSKSRSHDAQPSLSYHVARPYQPSIDSYPPEEMIGIALGSPRHPMPPYSQDGGTSWTSKSPEPIHSCSQLSEGDALRSKGSRWKTFGGLFGKRSGYGQNLPASSHYQIHEKQSSPHSHRTHDQLQHRQTSSVQMKPQDSTGESQQNGLSRDWIGPAQLHSPQDREDQGFRRKPSLRRNNVLRKQAKEVQKADTKATKRLKGQNEGKCNPSSEVTATRIVPRPMPRDSPLLQVEIPNIELERYSIMFSALLQPSQQSNHNRQSSPKRPPSLLARRQANFQELQTAPNSGFERPWMRGENLPGNRAASPNKSPSFSLFPPSPTAGRGRNQSSMRERSPLQRSATTPGAISPSKAKFDFSSTGEQQDQVIVIVHTPTEQPATQRRVTSEDFFSHMPSQGDRVSDDTVVTAGASPVPSAKSSQARLNARSPSPQRPAAEESLQKAAEISIARQISISQRQRQLLVPGVPKVAPQPMQPTIVDV